MATEAQRQAARRNIRKAHIKWRSMTPEQRRRNRPDKNVRAEPGTGGSGRYYRIVVRPKHGFITFRNQDVGRRGGLQRLAGQLPNGDWDTHAWLVSKNTAHQAGKTLVADSKATKELFKQIGTEPVHQRGDIFDATKLRRSKKS